MKVKVLKLDNSASNTDFDLSIDDVSNLGSDLAVITRVRNQALKQGTKAAKGRSDIHTGTKKPYRQKGTGNARQGSTKGPHFVGGGVAHGPRPDTTKLKLNKRYKRLFIAKSLALHAKNETFNFLQLGDADNKSLRNFFVEKGKTLLVYSKNNQEVARKVRNLPNVSILEASKFGAFNIGNYNNVLFDADSKEELESILKK